jgi:hypothetical protein
LAKDIEQELDAIFDHHRARVAESRSAAAGRSAAGEDFGAAAELCLTSVIKPALEHMARALNQRGVAARVPDGSDVRIDIPVSRHARLGQGLGGYPYLRAKPDRQNHKIQFERNTTDAHGGSVLGAYPIAEINAELVKTMVLELVRALYGPL